jgi:hypothetical protein
VNEEAGARPYAVWLLLLLLLLFRDLKRVVKIL